jgi:glycosyltransferase involved in cell wall biosynthesis
VKILYVIPTMGCGGAEILLGAIARNLVSKGHEVHIVCLLPHHETWPNFPDREDLLNEVKVSVIGGSVKFSFLRKPEIDNSAFKDYVEKIKPDVIHSHLYLSELLSRSIQFKGINYFSHGHDNMPQLKRFSIKTLFNKSLLANYWERNWLLKQYSLFNNRFIAISTDVKKYLEENVSTFKSRITYLPNAIETSRFHRERNYYKTKQNFHIVSIANLVPKKNHQFLIDVLRILINRGYDVTIDVLGFGPLIDALVEKTNKAGLGNRLRFLGSVGDVPQRLWDADLYVHPAWYEPFGLVILEAMATGLPVVSLDGFGNRELMFNNQNGFLVPTDATADEFADKIQYFIDQPSEIERMGKFALEFSKTYDISHYTDKLLEIYQTK